MEVENMYIVLRKRHRLNRDTFAILVRMSSHNYLTSSKTEYVLLE